LAEQLRFFRGAGLLGKKDPVPIYLLLAPRNLSDRPLRRLKQR
jgi:hypothetical protein